MALQMVGTNPGLLQNPAAKTMMFQLLALGGVSPVDIGLVNEQINQNPQMPQEPQVAGSMAKTMGAPGMMASSAQV